MCKVQLAEVIAYTSAALLMVMSVPQTVRAYRLGTAGVSTLTWWTIAAAVSMWVVYGLRTDSVVLVVANVAALVVTVATLLVLAHAHSDRWVSPAFGIAVALSLLLVVAMYVPLAVVVAGAVLLPIASRIPQLRASISSYRAAERTSVSRATWILAATGQTGWLIYGLMLGDMALIVVNVVCLVMALILLAADFANPGNRLTVRSAIG